jgi:hypothetical protein
MADTKTLIERAYAAFNERNVDGALGIHERRCELAQGVGGQQGRRLAGFALTTVARF